MLTGTHKRSILYQMRSFEKFNFLLKKKKEKSLSRSHIVISVCDRSGRGHWNWKSVHIEATIYELCVVQWTFISLWLLFWVWKQSSTRLFFSVFFFSASHLFFSLIFTVFGCKQNLRRARDRVEKKNGFGVLWRHRTVVQSLFMFAIFFNFMEWREIK